MEVRMGAIGPRETAQLSALEEFRRAAQTIHGLTEQFAAARSDEDQFASQIKRRYGRFKRALMVAGFDQIGQLAGSMEIAAGRGGSQRVKARTLREGIASIKFQLDTEERLIRKPSAEEEAPEGTKGSTEDKPSGDQAPS
jgi:hypothetical protein